MENNNMENERGKTFSHRKLIVVIFCSLGITIILCRFAYMKLKENLIDVKNTDGYYVDNIPENPENTFYIPLDGNNSSSIQKDKKRYLKLRLLGEEILPDNVISVINNGHAKKAMILKNAIKLYNMNGYELNDLYVTDKQTAISSPLGTYFVINEREGNPTNDWKPYQATIYDDKGKKIGFLDDLPHPSAAYISENTDLIIYAGLIAYFGEPSPGLVLFRRNGTIIKDFIQTFFRFSAFSYKHNILVGYKPPYKINNGQLLFINQNGTILKTIDIASFAPGRTVINLFMTDNYAFLLTSPTLKATSTIDDRLYKPIDLVVFDVSGKLVNIVRDILKSPDPRLFVNNKDDTVTLYSDLRNDLKIITYDASSNSIQASFNMSTSDSFSPSFVLYDNNFHLLYLCGSKPEYHNKDILIFRVVNSIGLILFEHNIYIVHNNVLAFYPSLSLDRESKIMKLTFGSFRKYMTIEETVK